MSRKSIHGRHLAFETLESRQMLAGNVTVDLVGDDLNVRGDEYSNRVHVYDNGSGVTVEGLTGTRLDGEIDGIQPFGKIDKLTINMRGGNDIVVIEDVGGSAFFDPDGVPNEVTGRITVRGGYGRDQIYVRGRSELNPEINGLTIYGGPARDRVEVDGVDIPNTTAAVDLYVNLGGGDDTSIFEQTLVFGAAVVDAGAGDDRVGLVNMSVFGSLRASLRAGNDRLAMQEVRSTGDIKIFGGGGRDEIGAIESQLLGNTVINGNRGRDTLLASSCTLGDAASDTIRVFGGLESDWLAIVNGNTINGDARVFGGGKPGFDRFYSDLSSTVVGTWARHGFERTQALPNLQDLLDNLLAIS